MPWVRFDDGYPIHRKVAGLKDGAYRVHTEAIFWCARNLTDGIIRAADINQVRARSDRHVTEIVGREAWHPADRVCPSCVQALADAGRSWPPDGWVIHDYLVFQPSRAQVLKDRIIQAERQRRWRDRKSGKYTPVDALRDASRDASVTTTPARTRPAPKEAGRGAPRAPADRRSAAEPGGDGRKDQNQPAALPPPDLLAATRAQLTTASRKARTTGARRERNALDQLRAATPAVPVPSEPAPKPEHPDPQETP